MGKIRRLCSVSLAILFLSTTTASATTSASLGSNSSVGGSEFVFELIRPDNTAHDSFYVSTYVENGSTYWKVMGARTFGDHGVITLFDSQNDADGGKRTVAQATDIKFQLASAGAYQINLSGIDASFTQLDTGDCNDAVASNYDVHVQVTHNGGLPYYVLQGYAKLMVSMNTLCNANDVYGDVEIIGASTVSGICVLSASANYKLLADYTDFQGVYHVEGTSKKDIVQGVRADNGSIHGYGSADTITTMAYGAQAATVPYGGDGADTITSDCYVIYAGDGADTVTARNANEASAVYAGTDGTPSADDGDVDTIYIDDNNNLFGIVDIVFATSGQDSVTKDSNNDVWSSP